MTDQLKIYVYKKTSYDPTNPQVKIGRSKRDVELRIKEQSRTFSADTEVDMDSVVSFPAYDAKGQVVGDKRLHGFIESIYPGSRINRKGSGKGAEWFSISIEDAARVVRAINLGSTIELAREIFDSGRTEDFPMRAEQEEAVRRTCEYFARVENQPVEFRRFLHDCKMRYGKTHVALMVAKRMELRRVLILTAKPSVRSAWRSEVNSHVNFAGDIYIDTNTSAEDKLAALNSKTGMTVCFMSIQDLLGKDSKGNEKEKNRYVFDTEWDLIIIDEYHHAAWNHRSTSSYGTADVRGGDAIEELANSTKEDDAVDDALQKNTVRSRFRLYLSGTPYRAKATGDFSAEQIFSWTYIDEQDSKAQWNLNNPGQEASNPYRALPQMRMRSYDISEQVRIKARDNQGWFKLNELMATKNGRFVHEDDVISLLNFISGVGGDFTAIANNLPFATKKNALDNRHSFWLVQRIDSAIALSELMSRHPFFKNYDTLAVVGDHRKNKVGNDQEAVERMIAAVEEGNGKKGTITISCGKLATGVTIKEWSAVFFLSDISTMETYFQAAFRGGSPWMEGIGGYENKKVVKEYFTVYDFSPNRQLTNIYSLGRNDSGVSEDKFDLWVDEQSKVETTIDDLLRWVPIYRLDARGSMVDVDVNDVINIAQYGISSTTLAKEWKSVDMVKMDISNANAITNDPEVVDALSRLVGEDMADEIVSTKSVSREDSLATSSGSSGRGSGSAANTGGGEPKSAEDKEREKAIKEAKQKLVALLSKMPHLMFVSKQSYTCLEDLITGISNEEFESVMEISPADFMTFMKAGIIRPENLDGRIRAFRVAEKESLGYLGFVNPLNPKNS